MLIFVLQQDGLPKQIAERDSELPRHLREHIKPTNTDLPDRLFGRGTAASGSCPAAMITPVLPPRCGRCRLAVGSSHFRCCLSGRCSGTVSGDRADLRRVDLAVLCRSAAGGSLSAYLVDVQCGCLTHEVLQVFQRKGARSSIDHETFFYDY